MPTRITPPPARTRLETPRADPVTPASPPPAATAAALINDAAISSHSAWSSARTAAEVAAVTIDQDMPDATLVFENQLI